MCYVLSIIIHLVHRVGLFLDMVYSLCKNSTSSMPENVYSDPDDNE